ncbi:MAG: DUF2027 domain-containing protein [Bacteroidota bacterium]
MKFKIGDKVKFLNEKGGGVISKILSNTMVHVAIDDGFDLPVMASDLILIESSTAGERFFEEHYNVSVPKPATPVAKPGRKAYDMPEAIYLAVVPDDQQRLIIGDVEVLLVNNSAFDIIYTVFLKDKDKYLGIDYGNIEAYSTSSLQVADRDQLEYFAQGMLQLLFFQDEVHDIIPPVQKEFRIKMVKLLKEDNYTENAVFRNKAYLQKVADLPELALPKDAEAQPQVQKIPEAQLKRESMIKKHRIDDEFAEVDLHIEALCEKPNELRSHEKMQIQLDYFTRCLESAIAENYKKVIFIHGVGAGILKLELTNILQQYEFLEYFDASIAKYGIGATEVLIHQRKE